MHLLKNFYPGEGHPQDSDRQLDHQTRHFDNNNISDIIMIFNIHGRNIDTLGWGI